MFSTEELKHTKTEISWSKFQILKICFFHDSPPFRLLGLRNRAMLKYGCDVEEDIPRKMKVEERMRSRADKHKKQVKACHSLLMMN